MSFLSTCLLVLVLFGSWAFINQKPAISEYVHMSIQSDVRGIITSYIESQNPNAQDLKFQKLWSETVNKNQVKAHFAYSYNEDSLSESSSNIELSGYAILNKDLAASSPGVYQWNLDQLYILNNAIEFNNPVQISPNDDEQ